MRNHASLIFAIATTWMFTLTMAYFWGRSDEAELALDFYNAAEYAENLLEECIELHEVQQAWLTERLTDG